jgi:hypothetical protein
VYNLLIVILPVHGPNENDSDVTGPTAAETATQQTKHKPAPSPGPQVSLTQQPSPASPSSECAMSGLANVKHKLAEIYKEREKCMFSQQKIKDDVSEMTDSFTKMSGDMVNLRKDLSDLSESVWRQMKELKEMMSSLINNSTLPSRGSSKRKKGKSSGTEHGSSSDETGSRKHIHASKSWNSMCESDDDKHRKQRSARPSIANDNSATSVREGTDMY